MYITNIEWHKPTEKLPEKSGEVLIYSAHCVQTVIYSSKWQLFNSHDDYHTENSAKQFAIYPQYWAEFPELPKTESKDA